MRSRLKPEAYRSYLMLPKFSLTLTAVAALFCAGSFAAQAQGNPTKADNAAISACLQQVFKANEAYEKLTDKQKEKAEQPGEPNSCIGTVSSACQEKIKGDPNKGLLACNNRELAVWSAFMDRRVAAYLKDAKPDGSAAMKKVQSAFSAYRAARCAYPAIDNEDKGLAAALKSACELELTARQALWIDTREN